MNAETWSREEFGSARLGDRRRDRRLLRLAARVAEAPAGTVSGVFSVPAEREAAYRLLSNVNVHASEIAASSHRACVERCRGEPFVFVPEDGSSVNITDSTGGKGTGPIGSRERGARGFQLMNAIAVSRTGVPLGICGQGWWAREEVPDRRSLKARRPEEKETQEWVEVMNAVAKTFAAAGPGSAVPWFQLDRGGDAWPVLLAARDAGQWLTVRSSSDRRLVDDEGGGRRYLRATMAIAPIVGGYDLDVPGGHGRKARIGRMIVRTTVVTLLMTDDRTSRTHEMPVWCVWTREEASTTPEGEKPLDWMLLTTRPLESFTAAKLTIFGYSMRWRVEEFHKAWKTGHCDVEDVQLRSEEGIRTWATLLAATAMRLLRMTYLARNDPTRPATDEFTVDEIHAVHLAKKKRWNGKRVPSIAQVTLWIAEVGGYFGKSAGPPGMIVISRGWARVLPIAQLLPMIRGAQEGEFEM